MRFRTVSVTLRENTARLDRDALQRSLLAERGIEDVFFRAADQYRLFVQYDPAVLNDSRLLDTLYKHGVHPQPVEPKTRFRSAARNPR